MEIMGKKQDEDLKGQPQPARPVLPDKRAKVSGQ
jgi:hypothetical protein